MKKPNKHDRVLMICPNEQVEKDVNDLFRRAAGVLRFVEDFANAAVELDTDAPDFREKVGPPLEKFFIGIVTLYPNPAQVEGDIEILANSMFANIKNKQNKGH